MNPQPHQVPVVRARQAQLLREADDARLARLASGRARARHPVGDVLGTLFDRLVTPVRGLRPARSPRPVGTRARG
jgi:hypothetical protein